jgi:hypothetical protein
MTKFVEGIKNDFFCYFDTGYDLYSLLLHGRQVGAAVF